MQSDQKSTTYVIGRCDGLVPELQTLINCFIEGWSWTNWELHKVIREASHEDRSYVSAHKRGLPQNWIVTG